MNAALTSTRPYRRPASLENRIRQLEEARPRLLIDRALYFTESMREAGGGCLPLAWARAMVNVMEHIHIEILPGERLVGSFGSGRYGIFYPELGADCLERDDCISNAFFISENDIHTARTSILPYWQDRTLHKNFFNSLPDKLKRLLYLDGNPRHPAFIVQETATLRHALQWALDYEKVIRHGIRGVVELAREKLEQAEDETQKGFYTAVEELGLGIRRFAGRFALLAEEQAFAERQESRRHELLSIAERCRRIPWEPAESFLDALQAQWFTQLVSRIEAEHGGNISNGRMDQYLWPLYWQDMQRGTLTEQLAREYLDELWCHMAQHVRLKPSPTGEKIYEDFAHWEFTTIGGVLKDGSDAANELSHLILRSAMEFPLDYPYLGVRLHPHTSSELLKEICLATQRCGQSPALLNDETIIRRQIRNGASPEEARDYCGSGFSEVRLINKDTYLIGGAWLNLPAVLEMAMMDGYCTANPSYRTGLASGGPDQIQSFSQLLTAFELQLMYVLEQTFQMQNILEGLHPGHVAFPLVSSLHDLCMKHGVDISSGSVPEGRSIGSFLGVVGFATVIDSLAAINTLVFREKKLSLKHLLEILSVNFEDEEYVRQLCLACPKYGERIDWVDELGKWLDRILLTRVHSEVNRFGGRAELFYVPVKAYIAMGRVTGATADGRFSGCHFSFGSTPSPCMGHLGPTVALTSEAATQNSEFHSLGARVMRANLLPHHLSGRQSVDTLMSIMQTWSRQEHWFLQFHVLTPSELAMLKNSPSEYNNLSGNISGLNSQGYAFPSAAFSHRYQDENI